MRKSRFTEAQIIGMIKKQEAGLSTAELWRKHGLSPATFYKLKAKYGGMDLSDTKRLKQLEDENANLRQPGRRPPNAGHVALRLQQRQATFLARQQDPRRSAPSA